MYKLKITAKAKKELKDLKKIHREALMDALDEIKENPFIGKPLTRDLSNQFSIKVGIYRIIYKTNMNDYIITILTAGHRSTVYN
jgi:mRNA interferase RelE/StbE